MGELVDCPPEEIMHRVDGPGPHDPPDGILGGSSVEGATGMRCNSPACQPIPPADDTPDLSALRATVAKATTVAQLRGAMLAYLDATT